MKERRGPGDGPSSPFEGAAQPGATGLVVVLLGAVAAAQDAKAGRETPGALGLLVRRPHPERRVRGGQRLHARGVVLRAARERAHAAAPASAGGPTPDPRAHR